MRERVDGVYTNLGRVVAVNKGGCTLLAAKDEAVEEEKSD